MKDLLGGKGANLAEMTKLGLPVPPGFTITTEACRAYLNEGAVPAELATEVTQALRDVEDELGRHLGDPKDPLLVSVRSGAKFSMPGMMETVLNIGLNDQSVVGLAEISQDERFAWDSYRRLIQMFGKTSTDPQTAHDIIVPTVKGSRWEPVDRIRQDDAVALFLDREDGATLEYVITAKGTCIMTIKNIDFVSRPQKSW